MTSSAATQDVRLRPTCVTYWEHDAKPEILDPRDPGDLERLRVAFESGKTAWIETLLDGLDTEQDAWLKGEFDPWTEMPTPRVDWSEMAVVLGAVDLEPPAPERRDGEEPTESLLRSLSYAYSRGAFGTVRDALSEADAAAKLGRGVSGAPLTAFPTAGFVSGDWRQSGERAWYTVLHATIGVVGSVVVSVRLPDAYCPDDAPADGGDYQDQLVPAGVLRRFLPLRRLPTGREVAEAIGMHQATTARAVAREIRTELTQAERHAQQLNAEKDQGTSQEPNPQEEVVEDAVMIDKLTEIAHLLDRHISTLLRRFSGRIPDAAWPARELVPPEVERRYRFALDNVHALHQECRLSSQVTGQALMVYEQKRHERFQFIAALLASVVLIPTLFASLFGVNFNVPAQNNKHGFLAFLVVIGVSGVVAYIALKRAQQRDWKLERRERIWFGIAAGIIVLAFVGLFAWLS